MATQSLAYLNPARQCRFLPLAGPLPAGTALSCPWRNDLELLLCGAAGGAALAMAAVAVLLAFILPEGTA